jgi:hypothetical protein
MQSRPVEVGGCDGMDGLQEGWRWGLSPRVECGRSIETFSTSEGSVHSTHEGSLTCRNPKWNTEGQFYCPSMSSSSSGPTLAFSAQNDDES